MILYIVVTTFTRLPAGYLLNNNTLFIRITISRGLRSNQCKSLLEQKNHQQYHSLYLWNDHGKKLSKIEPTMNPFCGGIFLGTRTIPGIRINAKLS